MKQVHSLCVDSRPGDRLRLAPSLFFFCQAQSEAHGPPSAMAVRKTTCSLSEPLVISLPKQFMETFWHEILQTAQNNQLD